MSVKVHMDALADESMQHIHAKRDEHDADDEFQANGHAVRDRSAQEQHGTTEQQQRYRMTDAPGHSLSQAMRKRVLPGHERRHGGQMIGLHRVPQAQKKTDQQRADFVHGVRYVSPVHRRSAERIEASMAHGCAALRNVPIGRRGPRGF